MENFCNYYQAYLARPHVVVMIGILKSFDHLCFDRTLDPATSLFEFFVPQDQVSIFIALMEHFQTQGMVTEFKQLPNRLVTEEVL